MFGFNFTEMLLGIPGLIIAMTFHEYAHARAAVSLGDFTPRLMGRLTIDPRAHIDPIGLIMLFLVRFGWAKPVMINPVNFRNPKRDDIIVSLAGPAMNLLLGFIAFYMLYFIRYHNIDVSAITFSIIQMIFIYNVNFAVFNILPIPPLTHSAEPLAGGSRLSLSGAGAVQYPHYDCIYCDACARRRSHADVPIRVCHL